MLYLDVSWVDLGELNSMLGPTYPPIPSASLLAHWCPTR